MSYERELEDAIQAVGLASDLCKSVRATLVTDESIAKRDKSPVTVADFGAQAVVSLSLGGAYPDVPIVGEEEAGALRDEAGADLRAKVLKCVDAVWPGATPDTVLDAIDRCSHAGGPTGRYWVLDPIDGTKGFLRNEQYAVALALVEDGEVVLGVLGCPNMPRDGCSPDGPTGVLFAAAKGSGAWQIDHEGARTRISVSPESNLAAASFCESVESGHSSHGDAEQIAELLGVTAPPIRMDSQCKYGAIGRGDAAIYLRLPTRADYEERIWDHAAGWIVVKEAGGEVSDVRGAPLNFSLGRTLAANKGVVATNGLFHGEVISAVKRVLAA